MGQTLKLVSLSLKVLCVSTDRNLLQFEQKGLYWKDMGRTRLGKEQRPRHFQGKRVITKDEPGTKVCCSLNNEMGPFSPS